MVAVNLSLPFVCLQCLACEYTAKQKLKTKLSVYGQIIVRTIQ